MPPLPDVRKKVLIDALYHHFVQPRVERDAQSLNGGCNWLEDEDLGTGSIAEGEALLRRVAAYTAMSNDSLHPRVSACYSLEEQEVAIRGAALASGCFALSVRQPGTQLIGLLECVPGPLYNQFKIKLGAITIFQADESDPCSWDFRYGWERQFGHLHINVEGELLDNGFVQRLAAVMDWESVMAGPRTPHLGRKRVRSPNRWDLENFQPMFSVAHQLKRSKRIEPGQPANTPMYA